MPIKYEVSASTGSYTDKNGQEKRRWTKCGVVIESDKGTFLKLDVIPVQSNGLFSLFEPKSRDSQTESRDSQTEQKTLGDMEDDAPF